MCVYVCVCVCMCVCVCVCVLTGTELAMFLDVLNLHKKELILLAVNDNVSVSAGGSHW